MKPKIRLTWKANAPLRAKKVPTKPKPSALWPPPSKYIKKLYADRLAPKPAPDLKWPYNCAPFSIDDG